MHQTKKGNQWYFGMKVHIGVDKDSGLNHSVETTSANMHDITRAAQLLHGDEEVVYGDAAYLVDIRHLKWLAPEWIFGWRCDRGNAEPSLKPPMAGCKI